jgi:3-hydroxyisobutyrate dehydrogenase
VFSRTASKTESLVAQGAKFMSASEVAQNSDLVFLMLGYPKDLEQVLFENDGGILK